MPRERLVVIGLPNYFYVSKITMGTACLFPAYLSRHDLISPKSEKWEVLSVPPKLKTDHQTPDRILAGRPTLPTTVPVTTPPRYREAQAILPSGPSSDKAALVSKDEDAVMGVPDNESDFSQKVDGRLQHDPADTTTRVNESAYAFEQVAGKTKARFTAKRAVHGPADARQPEEGIGTVIARIFREIVSCFSRIVFPWQSKQPGQDGYSGKDISEIFQKLQCAVEEGNAKATELQLKKVLELNPVYSTDVPLTAIAARGRRADVLEILVRNGMALPQRATSWTRYGEAIGDYLRWVKANRQGTAAPEVLSFVAQTLLVKNYLKLTLELNESLNGEALNKKQKACSVKALIEDETQAKALVEVDAKTYSDAGFTEETAKAMADAFNANASRHINRKAGKASATLATAVTGVLNNFKDYGSVWPDPRKYLMNKGMYGVLADLVVTALNSAAEQSTAPDADRGMLLVHALEQSAEEAVVSVHAASDASGDPDLFDKLLSPQLDLLIAYCTAQRKRAATTTSGQPKPSAGAD